MSQKNIQKICKYEIFMFIIKHKMLKFFVSYLIFHVIFISVIYIRLWLKIVYIWTDVATKEQHPQKCGSKSKNIMMSSVNLHKMCISTTNKYLMKYKTPIPIYSCLHIQANYDFSYWKGCTIHVNDGNWKKIIIVVLVECYMQ